MKIRAQILNAGKSITRRLLIACVLSGIAMGLVLSQLAKSTMGAGGSLAGYTFWGLLCGVSTGIICYYWVKRLLLVKLSMIAQVASAIRERDLSKTCEIVGNDEVAQLAKHTNGIANFFRDLVDAFDDTAKQLHETAQRMASISAETEDCLQAQHAQTEHVVTAMNQMTQTVQEVSSRAERASVQATEADTEAKHGALISTNAIAGSDALVSKVQEASTVIVGLQEDTDNIGLVLDVIRGIAEQTNLLALNAAIEAARAGEQGRGFAVVADEVRTLASRTQASTQEIQTMIERLQSKATIAADVMAEACERGNVGIEQVEAAAISLAEISGSVASVQSMNQQIATAAGQQLSVAEEIHRSIENMHHVTEQTTAGTQQLASASSQLKQLAGQLSEVMSGFHR